MLTLDRLIHRIRYPFNVANEDVIDDIKRYWDEAADTVTTYWNGTDDEIAEEIGVTKPSLAELLDDHRVGSPYANIGGNSGVSSYDYGEDWFAVNFTTGSRYIYTLKSTTPESLGYLKKYAHEGKGLNSYIMRKLKMDYAGRNVKGQLVIKPGMEQYARQANKRIEILEAYRNTMNTQISNEGIFDSLKRLFSSKPKTDDKRDEPTPQTFIWDEAGAIEKSPPKQLVQVSSDSPIFQTNGSYNPNWIKRLEGDLKHYDKLFRDITNYDKKIASWKNKWEPKLDEFVGDADRPDEFVKVIKGFVAEQPKPWLDVFQDTYDFVGYGKSNWTDDEGFAYRPMPKGASVTVPVQDENQTKRIVALIGKLGKLILDGSGEDLTWTHYDMTDPPFRGYVREDTVDTILNDLKYHMDASISPYDHFSVIDHRYVDILKALVKYVKSAESNAIGNEVYVQTALNKFRGQIDQAGQDGLDLVACKFMTVGLESMVVKPITSVEAHDEPTPLNETTRLRKIIESELSVSNEGIWGAIKYLFGGNYEDLPKINAAYDEAVDAVKSTYANPQWVKGRRLNTDKPITIKHFSAVAQDPAKAFEKVKRVNGPAVDDANNYVKEEVEYLSKFTKVLTSGDDAKIKALLDMFEVRKPRDLTIAESVDLDDGGTVKGLSAEGILKAAEVFIEAVKYRRTTDALYTQGMYKLMYTDSGKVRYGNGGEVTNKLSGSAKELAIKIGESANSVEKSFFNAFVPAWDNIDGIVRGTLMILEASAK